MANHDRPCANLAIVCNTLRGGGVSRTVTTLCNAWSRQGRLVYLIPLKNHESFFDLAPSIKRLEPWTFKDQGKGARFFEKSSKWLARTLAILKRFSPSTVSRRLSFIESLLWLWPLIQPLRATIRQVDAPTVISFGPHANIQTILGRCCIIQNPIEIPPSCVCLENSL